MCCYTWLYWPRRAWLYWLEGPGCVGPKGLVVLARGAWLCWLEGPGCTGSKGLAVLTRRASLYWLETKNTMTPRRICRPRTFGNLITRVFIALVRLGLNACLMRGEGGAGSIPQRFRLVQVIGSEGGGISLLKCRATRYWGGGRVEFWRFGEVQSSSTVAVGVEYCIGGVRSIAEHSNVVPPS